MQKIQKNFIIMGIILILIIPIWVFLIVPELEKIDNNYNITINYLRLANDNYEIGGEWSGERIVKGTTIEKTKKIEGNIQVIEGSYIAQELNDQILWEVKNSYGINRITRQTVPGYENYVNNSYYLFPIKLKKQNYAIWIAQYPKPLDLKFKGVEDFKGLEVYHFGLEDFITDVTKEFEWLESVPEIYNAKAVQTVNILVEPITGIIVNYKGGGTVYYTDKETNQRIQGMQSWTNEYNTDTITNQIITANNQKNFYLLIELIIPIFLILIATAFFISSFLAKEE